MEDLGRVFSCRSAYADLYDGARLSSFPASVTHNKTRLEALAQFESLSELPTSVLWSMVLSRCGALGLKELKNHCIATRQGAKPGTILLIFQALQKTQWRMKKRQK